MDHGQEITGVMMGGCRKWYVEHERNKLGSPGFSSGFVMLGELLKLPGLLLTYEKIFL